MRRSDKIGYVYDLKKLLDKGYIRYKKPLAEERITALQALTGEELEVINDYTIGVVGHHRPVIVHNKNFKNDHIAPSRKN